LGPSEPAPARRRAAGEDLPFLALCAALIVAAAVLVGLCWQLTFFQDAWGILLERRPWNAHSLLDPFNEHLIVFQVATTKLFVAVFGMGDNHPEAIFNVAAILASAALLFVYVRRRVGGWPAVFAACLLLFLGTAWQDLLWPFEMGFTVGLAAGIGILLALEREDGRGDLLAMVLLLAAVGYGSFGISFGFAALADVCVKHRRRGWGRLWILVLPVVLYLGWYAGWGHDAEHHLTIKNILNSPLYVFEAGASAVASISGLSPVGKNATGQALWGRPLLIALLGLAIWWKRRNPRFDPSFWPLLAALLSYWLLAAFNYIPGREADASRYQFAAAGLVLLLAAELLRGQRLGTRGVWVAAAVTAVMLGPNIAQLGSGYDSFKEQTELARGDTAAIELASGTVDPAFRLGPEIAGTPSLINVSAGPYLEAVAEHGSPAYSPAELTAAGANARRWADRVLAQALPLDAVVELEGYEAAAAQIEGCTVVPAGGLTVPEVALTPGKNRIEIAPGGAAQLSMRRFATPGEYPVKLPDGPGGSVVVVDVPTDTAASESLWAIHVVAGQEATVCPSVAGG
jgi:hypothetical protein